VSTVGALTKYVGAGNDFWIQAVAGDPSLVLAHARMLLDRREGLGGDGLIAVELGGETPRMHLCNQDGSPAEMSGNGLRCLGHHLLASGLCEGAEVVVETLAGPRRYRRLAVEGRAWQGATEMGVPRVVPDPQGVRVQVGNPHLVIEVGDAAELEALPISVLGAELQAGGGVNVEWVALESPSEVRMRVFERGVGETLACGTGSVAVAASLRAAGRVGERVMVWNPGGPLEVRFEGESAWLIGWSRRIAAVSDEEAPWR